MRPLFAVIPAQAGIQWLLRGARLDPGSALRAVRDDISKRGSAAHFAVIPAKSLPPRRRGRGSSGSRVASVRISARRAAHSSRSATLTGTRAARSAGKMPPMKPMASAHFRPCTSSTGLTWNWNTTWLKSAPSVLTV